MGLFLRSSQGTEIHSQRNLIQIYGSVFKEQTEQCVVYEPSGAEGHQDHIYDNQWIVRFMTRCLKYITILITTFLTKGMVNKGIINKWEKSWIVAIILTKYMKSYILLFQGLISFLKFSSNCIIWEETLIFHSLFKTIIILYWLIYSCGQLLIRNTNFCSLYSRVAFLLYMVHLL